eukprot:SM000124S25906  [mRNA]  locus=s124:15515:16492:+ [translate_table: standard]
MLLRLPAVLRNARSAFPGLHLDLADEDPHGNRLRSLAGWVIEDLQADGRALRVVQQACGADELSEEVLGGVPVAVVAAGRPSTLRSLSKVIDALQHAPRRPVQAGARLLRVPASLWSHWRGFE